MTYHVVRVVGVISLNVGTSGVMADDPVQGVLVVEHPRCVTCVYHGVVVDGRRMSSTSVSVLSRQKGLIDKQVRDTDHTSYRGGGDVAVHRCQSTTSPRETEARCKSISRRTTKSHNHC